MSGLFIAFEGVDGAGKTTQAHRLVETLQQHGRRALLVREPGSTQLGETIRECVVHGHVSSRVAELLLFAAARAELVATVIAPALADGVVVVADRFAASTLAYQGHGRGLDLADVHRVNDLATGGLYPTVTYLLDLDPAVGRTRRQHRQRTLAHVPTADRFEAEEAEFYEQVHRGYLAEFAANKRQPRGRWHLVSALPRVERVADTVWQDVDAMLADRD